MDSCTFFKHLRRSRLLSAEQVDEMTGRFGETVSARDVARTLIADGLLTRYQARRLLAGKARRLRLGQYTLLEPLGKGGMGQVFKARHTVMDRVVALKLISPELVQDRHAFHMFQREVRAATQLQHPNIVLAFDANAAKGVHYLVLEYVEGRTLDAWVKQLGPLPIGIACEVMRQAALALQYAHEKGMLHRDIKPANLILQMQPGERQTSSEAEAGAEAPSGSPTATLTVKVLDFGLARLHRPAYEGRADTIQVETGTVLGTPEYISPEQIHDIHTTDIRSDLYSLGCTFYFALTGQIPFTGRTAMEKLLKHLTKEPTPVEALRPEVPPPIATIVRRLMAKDPAERFPSPAELLRELAPWCGAENRWASAVDVSLTPAPSGNGVPVPVGPGQAVPVPIPPPPSTIDQLTAAPVPTIRIDAALGNTWRRWTDVVEVFIFPERLRTCPRLTDRDYGKLYESLLTACQVRATQGEAGEREFFQRLEDLVRPWLSLDTLAREERPILYSLLQNCRQAEKEFEWELVESEPAELPAQVRTRHADLLWCLVAVAAGMVLVFLILALRAD